MTNCTELNNRSTASVEIEQETFLRKDRELFKTANEELQSR